ncbi:hypothetical protein [Streptomyces sp. NPDC090025]|uniref:hypothetical protein n=1 Tax=Streptomyces sp. NPDC090025 TaxID=3365922 RepID=UPI003836C618
MTTDRLLPLGEAADGAWLAERVARAVLGAAARGVPGVRAERPRFRLAEDAAGDGGTAPFPVPPGGLPPGPLRVALDFAAVAGRPLPELADRVRAALRGAAEGVLGLVVAEVDLRVTELLDPGQDGAAGPSADPSAAPSVDPAGNPADPAGPPGRTLPPAPGHPAALAALAVPGVAGLTDTFGPPLHRPPDGGLRIEVAVTAGRRLLDVTRALRTAVTAAAPEATTVTVVVSELR